MSRHADNLPCPRCGRSGGLLPVSLWPKVARTDEFYRVMFEGCFTDAEDLARFLLKQRSQSQREQPTEAGL